MEQQGRVVQTVVTTETTTDYEYEEDDDSSFTTDIYCAIAGATAFLGIQIILHVLSSLVPEEKRKKII